MSPATGPGASQGPSRSPRRRPAGTARGGHTSGPKPPYRRSPRPPRLAEWLLSRLLACDSRDALLGDLAEEYALRCRAAGARRAHLWYWKQLVASIVPSRRQRAELRTIRHPRRPRQERKPSMDGLVQDLRHALRSLRRSPGYTAGTVATIVLGLALSTVMFTVAYDVMGRPLPYENADHLVVLLRGDAGDAAPDLPMSYPAYEFWRDNARAFEQLAAYDRHLSITMRFGDEPVAIPAARVSAGYFTMLGVAPALGRGFRPEEDEVGADTVMILSNEVWVTRFGSDPDIIGRRVRLARSEGTVIGVMPAGFHDVHDRPRLWISMAGETRRPDTNSLNIVGRVRDGLSPQQVAEDTDRVRTELASAGDDEISYDTVVPVPLHDWRVGEVAPFLRILGAVGAVVVLIVVANLTNLALVHTANRRKELAVRAAIGAGRSRIVRLVLAEALLLGTAGAGLALLVAWRATALFLRLSPETVPRQAEIGFDAPMLLFALLGGVLASSTATSLALAAGRRRGLAAWLRPGGRRSDRGASGHKAQGTLAVAQLGLALALLVAVGLLLRSLQRMQAVDTGFVAHDALVVDVSAPSTYAAGAERRGFYEELMTGIRALPGVEAIGAVSFMPFGGWSTTDIRIEGMEVPADELPSVEIDAASPGFFAAMGTRFVRGRAFLDSDDENAPRVAIVNRAMAERYWPGDDAIGKRLIDDEDEEDGPKTLTIVGVVENVSARGVTEPVGPKFYTAYRQSDYWWPFGMTLVLRSSTPPETQVAPIRGVLSGIVADPPLAFFTTLEDFLDDEFVGIRFQTRLFGVFAVVAVLLASVGLYGVIASGVARRTHEIGVRMALGADAARMLRQVIVSGAKLGLIGTLIGTPLALLMARTMQSMLFGVSVVDVPTLVGTVALLNAVCIVACFVPARRASRVAPLEAMRE